MLRGSYSLDGDGRPCCPCSPSAILFFPTPTPTPTTLAVPYQPTSGKTRAHHRAVRWRPDGSQKASRRPTVKQP